MVDTAPFFDAIADAPPGGAPVWLRTRDDVRIRAATWPAAAGAPDRGTVLLFNGRSEYIEKYGAIIAHLTGLGFAVATLDWRGQGLSDRRGREAALGHVVDFAEYQNDVAALLAHLPAAGLDPPEVLLSHSMGGCIALRALLNGLPVRAAAFSAPMWGIKVPLNIRALAATVATVGTAAGLGQNYAPFSSGRDFYVMTTAFEDNLLTDDAQSYAKLRAHLTDHPELGLGGPSLSWLRAALRETAALGRARLPDLPVTTWLGTREEIVSIPAIRAMVARWPSAQLLELPGARHEVMVERPEVVDAVWSSFDALIGDAPRGTVA